MVLYSLLPEIYTHIFLIEKVLNSKDVKGVEIE